MDFQRGVGTLSCFRKRAERPAQWFRELKKPTLVGDSFTVTVMKLAVTSVTKTCSRRLRAGLQSVSVSESVALLPRLGLLLLGNRASSVSDSLVLVSSESPVLSSFRFLF